MVSGGARSHSGPPSDPASLRSMKRGLRGVVELPSEGFAGPAPDFPVPQLDIFKKVTEEDGVIRYEFDAGATRKFRERELGVWADHWAFPQAASWTNEPWCWLEIAHFCRTVAQVERDPAPSASLQGRLSAYRLSLGLSSEGLKARGWAIAVDVVGEKRSEQQEPTAPASSRDRLTVVDGSGS